MINTEEKTLTAQKMKFSIKDFLGKYDQIRRKLRIWSHLLEKSLMDYFIFYAVSQSISVRSYCRRLTLFISGV